VTAPEQKYYLEWFDSLGSLLFPKVCITCGESLPRKEDIICISCHYKLPKTNFHTYPSNPVAQKFWGRIPVNAAFSFLFFQKGNLAQHLLHALKYQGRQDIGHHLGSMFGNDLAKAGYIGPELIVPLPLHANKFKLRGYNQCTSIVNGMQTNLGLPVSHSAVLRIKANTTQTNKSRFERWKNVEYIFSVAEPEKIAGKHVLLVDDMVTTGSTLEACARVLLESGAREVSLATLACG
jgi:ComF family protein